MIAIVAAIAHNNVIGKSGGLPWYIPKDLEHFKKTTAGSVVIMGRKTFESILAHRHGKPLDDRVNIVVSTNKTYAVPQGVEVFPSLEDALKAHKNEDNIYLIGGGQIFAEGLAHANKLIITHLRDDYDGDVLFPNVNWRAWKKTEEEPHADFTFTTYERLQ